MTIAYTVYCQTECVEALHWFEGVFARHEARRRSRLYAWLIAAALLQIGVGAAMGSSEPEHAETWSNAPMRHAVKKKRRGSNMQGVTVSHSNHSCILAI